MNIIDQLRAAHEKATPGPAAVMAARTAAGACDIGNPETNLRLAVIRDVRRFGADGNIDPTTEDEPLANARLFALAKTHMGALLAVCDAARAYRAAEQEETPRLWKGRRLCDLSDALDVALAALTQETPEERRLADAADLEMKTAGERT